MEIEASFIEKLRDSLSSRRVSFLRLETWDMRAKWSRLRSISRSFQRIILTISKAIGIVGNDEQRLSNPSVLYLYLHN